MVVIVPIVIVSMVKTLAALLIPVLGEIPPIPPSLLLAGPGVSV